MWTFYFDNNETFKFYFQKKNVFVEEEGNPSDKIVLVEEELDGMDIDGIAN